jgi:hypothetical protein
MQDTLDFLKSLPWLALKPLAKNYQIIVIPFYLNIIILGVKIARVTRAIQKYILLISLFSLHFRWWMGRMDGL